VSLTQPHEDHMERHVAILAKNTPPTNNRLLEAALGYAALGLAVIPLYQPIGGGCSCRRVAKCDSPGKHPRTKNGVKDGSTDPAVIHKWWSSWPDANVGIVTGRPSGGLVVLDVDGEKGLASMAQLEQQQGPLRETWTVTTGGGGYHYSYLLPAGVTVNNSAGKLAPGLDIRCDGGYVVAPPSLHASGQRYAFNTSHDAGLMPALCPDWLLRLIHNPPAPESPTGNGAVIAEGGRHDYLVRHAGAMTRRGLAPAAIAAALLEENHARCYPPLLEEEVNEIARDISRRYPPSPAEPKVTSAFTGKNGCIPSAEPEWPKEMSDDAFHGLAGEFVKLVLPESEADQHALLVTFLVGFGCIVGRGPFYQVEATRHGVNLFTVLVGRTSTGRKGTATDRAVEILQLVAPEFFKRPGKASRLVSGLSSGEGLIHAVRDAREEDIVTKENRESRTERQVVDTGEEDKRLLVIEGEFARVPQLASGRTGNTLSATLRDAWDGKPLGVLARSNKDTSREPHIAVIGNVTPEEIQIELTTNDKANGFANRFLWVCSRRSKTLPYGGRPLDSTKKQDLIKRLKHALETAKNIGQVEFDAEAHAIWAPMYDELTAERDGLIGSMTARAAPLVLRLATAYALLDGSSKICKPHLLAAKEVWRYCEDSVLYIWGDALGDETADAIRKMLQGAPEGMTQTEISGAFGRHKVAADLARALKKLAEKGLIRGEQEATGGAPLMRWRIVKDVAKKAN
jgi:hypothetical protein